MKRTKKEIREAAQKQEFEALKGVLRNLPKHEFISYSLLFCDQIQRLNKGSRRYRHYVQLFEWCKSHYVVHFMMKLNEE